MLLVIIGFKCQGFFRFIMVISYVTVSKVSVTFSPFFPENDTQGIKGQMCLFPVESCQKTKPQFGEISR